MVADSSCRAVTAVDEGSTIDTAATVWSVFTMAAELPATPEEKQELAQAKESLAELLDEVGLTEQDLEAHLRLKYERQRDARSRQELVRERSSGLYRLPHPEDGPRA